MWGLVLTVEKHPGTPALRFRLKTYVFESTLTFIHIQLKRRKAISRHKSSRSGIHSTHYTQVCLSTGTFSLPLFAWLSSVDDATPEITRPENHVPKQSMRQMHMIYCTYFAIFPNYFPQVPRLITARGHINGISTFCIFVTNHDHFGEQAVAVTFINIPNWYYQSYINISP